MERHCGRWFLVCTALFAFTVALDQASFYGGSYVTIPLKEAKSSTDIHFKFRTRLPDALLLLVAGKTDYCIVQLDGGRLKVVINLGAGEEELYSTYNIKLNDFKWHDVFIVRKEGDLSMLIDNISKVRTHLPGNFFELNIHFGLFIGGIGNYTDLFFGHTENFRGCLAEVMYNGMLVLDQARRRQSQATVHSVTWNCAAEFDAGSERAISFVEDGAFMAIPHPISHVIKLQAEIKTLAQHSVVLYNPGSLAKMDFLALEVWKGKLRLLLKHAEKVIENMNDELISDGHWHKISLKLSANTIELNVDSQMKSIKVPRGFFVDLVDVYYFGGIELSKRARAMSKGLKTADISFKGCMRHISIGDKTKGFPDVHISEGLLSGCVWQYPCLRNPCSDNSICVQQGLDSFHCQCEDQVCTGHNYTDKVFSRTSFATELELLALDPLEGLEGQSVLITTNNLHMILDYLKYGIRDFGIKFTIVEPPAHGNVVIDVWPHEKNTFTLSDIARDKVNYIHDGSESQRDHIFLDVEFNAGELYILPAYLQGKFKFTLAVNVAPVNDPPTLKLSSTDVLRIAQGTKKTIESNLLQVVDPDSSAKQLVLNVVDAGPGHFEYAHKTSPISSFTLQDVQNHDVAYVHHITAANDSFVSLQVSDGIEVSQPQRLRVSAFPQYWRLRNNTGLVLVHLTAALVTPYNLSFVSNVANASDSAQFHLVQGPQFGVVEVERDVGTWENTVIFSSDDLKQHRVRYRHITSRPDYDEFQFRTTLNMTMLYTFRMTFAKCHLFAVNTNTLTLNESTEAVLTVRNLKYQTDPIESPTTSIVYEILKPPLHGYLFSAVSRYRMRYQDTFSQEDVLLENIKLKLFRKAYSPIVDNVVLNVIAPGCKNITNNLTIVHIPPDELLKKVQVLSEHLQVDEGSSMRITSAFLDVRANFVSDLIFNITALPEHGAIQVDKGSYTRKGTNYFTLAELKKGEVCYVHDDSETKQDQFRFMALSNEHEDFEYIDNFYIDIVLKNDNSPKRLIDKIFHVVVGGEKLLTGADLNYNDIDLDTRPTDIIYTFRDLPNGEFYNSLSPQDRLSEFTQDDLNNGRVLFKHKGPEYGKIKFWVTDGPYYLNGILEVQASAPFIRAVMNKRLIIEYGKCDVITKEHINFNTNVYAGGSDVMYEILNKPNYGKVIRTDTRKVIREFTQTDVNNGLVSYSNEISTSNADEVSLKIRCRDAVNVAQFSVWMLPASYWEPLQIKTSKLFSVEESTSAIIGKSTLEIVQPEVPANAIVYHVAELPEHGYISILSSSHIVDDQSPNIRSFSQLLMNENRIMYIQSVANETKDRIVFNVTNGMVWLNGVVLDIQIIPERLYLDANALSVNEGGVVVISPANVFTITEYYKSKITDYVVLEEPLFGCVQIHNRCNKLHGFSKKQLLAGSVQYAHDGSENLLDSIVLIAVAGEKRSIPVQLNVKILPINDQKPRVVNNTGLVMWEGGTRIISNAMLAATDDDMPAEILKFHVLGCWWGNISLVTDNKTTVQSFTQELIDKNMIVFKHQNGSEAKFSFNVSDGLHSTREYTFNIKTKPVKLSLMQKSLHIFPLQRKYLTSLHLLASVSDPDRLLYYEVTQSPQLGRLMMKSEKTPGIFNVVSGFTQDDLNNSRLFYEHIQPFAGLYANDSFVFNVKAHLAENLYNKKLKIDISVSSGGLDAYVNIPKLTVDEGGMSTITLNFSGVVSFLENHAGLRSPVIHAAAANPQHGQIFILQHPNLTVFTQQQLESGQVQYQHDHSDSLGDNIYFSLYLLPGYILLCNISVPVIINPINDQPFKLVTPAPHLIVVYGENHTISKIDLCTEDVDTAPVDLLYDIISSPAEGRIVLLPEGIPINHFTQADIDENRLVYIHNSSALTDSFTFRVWDGKFRPEYTIFNIKVLPIKMNVSGGLPVYIQQGMNVVQVSSRQFNVETNTNRNRLQYQIKESPRHGVIYVEDEASDRFNQNDLDSDRVMYMQRDMTTANDTFLVFVGVVFGNISIGKDVHVNIKVQPLMQMGNCTLLAGEVNRLSMYVLDATPLAKLTNSNPRYTIIMAPAHGQIRKIIRRSGEHHNALDTPVASFTHEEVQSGLIYVAVNDMEVGWNGVVDQLRFILAASIFQPAVAELKIIIRSSLHNDIYSTLPGPNDPAGHEGGMGGMHFASPNMTRDYFLIVSMVSGVIVLGVVVIIIIKCHSLEPDELNKEEQCLQPMPLPLPRPPDRLMSASPALKQTDGYVSPLAASLPHCKVTPLSRSGVGAAVELDSSGRYPYGAEEHVDDWSSCDASDPTCPSRNNIMLRRNQYWV